MLYVIHGTHIEKVADKANKLAAGLVARRDGARVFRFEGGVLDAAALDELIEAQGLFAERHIIVLRNPFESAEGRDIVLARVERFAATENVVIIAEDALTAEYKRVFEKHGAKIEEHTKEKVKKEPYNGFAMSDALGARDAKTLWLLYVTALRAGAAPEQLHGTLMWGVRNMVLATRAGSAEEAGMKQFPYDKAKRYARNFSSTELAELPRSLITLYHEARRQGFDLGLALERWILKL